MSSILVTGGTGTLGRPTVELLRATDHDIRILSRTSGDWTRRRRPRHRCRPHGRARRGRHRAAPRDERQFEGSRADRAPARGAAAGVDARRLHLDRRCRPQSRTRTTAQKIAAERAIEASGVPFTILRATQFHRFISRSRRRAAAAAGAPRPERPATSRSRSRRSPSGSSNWSTSAPAGHVPDIGGPEQLTVRASSRSTPGSTHTGTQARVDAAVLGQAG